MQAAPPVRVSIGRSAGWTAFVAGAAAAAAANLVAWLWLHAQAAHVGVAAALAGALAAAVSAICARRHAGGELAWDGAVWRWRGVAGQTHVALDLDGWMLLRFSPVQGRRQWIALSRSTTVGPWAALRAALYSRRPADPLDVPPA